MKTSKLKPIARILAFALLAGLLVATAIAAPVRLLRVEPPCWWVGHSHNPVRLMITGQNLADAQVEAPAGFGVGALHASTNGQYLFVDLQIPADSKPGNVILQVANSESNDRIAFQLLPRPASTNAFRGVSTDDVIYLIVTDRFANGDPSNDDPATSHGLYDRSQPQRYHGGDFQGVLNHLDYLKELGVTTLWLTPWYDTVNHRTGGRPVADFHGYSVVDFYVTENHFGDLPLLRKLVRQAHDRGFKVMQDQVVNHTSPYHPWVTNPPTPTWFNGTPAKHLNNTFQTWTTVVSNPPPDQLKATLEGWFFDAMPDLNQNDPEVGDYLIQNSLWWIGLTGVDAVRQDTLPYVPRAYWSRWTAALKQEFPHLTVLGEMWDGDPKRVAFFQGGQARFDGVDSGVDALFDFPLHYAMRDVFAHGQPMTRLTETLAADTNYVDPTRLVTFLGLHDQPRFLSEPGATLEGMKLAFAFLLTTRGTPLIYYGDEVAMRGGADPENRRDFPGGWPEDGANAFTAPGRTPEQEAIHAQVTKLVHLRQQLPALRQGRLVNLAVNRATYAYARVAPGHWAVVAINNSSQPQRLQVPLTGLSPTTTTVTDRLGRLGTVNLTDDTLRIVLPARTAAVLAP